MNKAESVFSAPPATLRDRTRTACQDPVAETKESEYRRGIQAEPWPSISQADWYLQRWIRRALLDAAIGPIKARGRGCTGGELLVGVAAAQLAGEDFLVGLDRWRADAAGQVLAPVAGLSSTTAA
jgi:hypothetical protein